KVRRMRVDARVAGELNRAMVFDLLRSRQIVSRIGLARETNLSKATISQIVDEFIRAGFVETLGPGQSDKGRRPTMLRFDPQARLVVGVELGDSSCTAVLTDLSGAKLSATSASVHAQAPDEAVRVAISLVRELTAEVPFERILGIGVGTPGLVDSQAGVIQMAPDLGWQHVSVGPRFAERFPVPVAVVNRAKAAALGEAWSGAGRQASNLVYVSVSTGISAGIVIGGQLYRGVSMSEGELGHVTVIPDGPLCQCGNRGCLQALAAGPAILARIRERLRAEPSSVGASVDRPLDLLSFDGLAELVAADATVSAVVDEAACYLGIAAANLVNVLNPGMLVLGGTVVRALPMLVPRIEREIRRRALSVPAAAVDVVSSQLGRDSVPIGAAAFVLRGVSVVGATREMASGS
ncbi:MAG TPA: ROK family transcriptional regulator, partial [Chloroflexota bacterium]|nr:ROK family transcriptional regulator [Chloroflexota bacterium]